MGLAIALRWCASPTPERLHPQLFGERLVAECLVADGPAQPDTVIAFALFFTNFSTFKCKPGL